MVKGLLFQTKNEESQQKRMLDLACCLRKQQNDLLDDHSREHEKHQVERSDSNVSTQPQIQSTTSVMSQRENPDAAKSRTEYIEEILKHLQKEDVSRVILHGKHGVGKTWIAREVAKHAFLRHIVDGTIWLSFESIIFGNNSEKDDEEIETDDEDLGPRSHSLYVNIVQQLSLQLDAKLYPESCMQKLEEGRYLLVFDDAVGCYKRILSKILLDLGLENNSLSKVLITTFAVNNKMMTCYDINRRVVSLEINHLTLSESKYILQQSLNNNDKQNLSDADLKEIVKRCHYLPAAIVFKGNVLLYALDNAPDNFSRKLAVTEAKKEIDDYWMIDFGSGYEKFRDNIRIHRFFYHCVFYLYSSKLANYNELILSWILEGHFLLDSTTSLEEVYTEAYNALMDLLDAGLLGERQVGYVALERAGFEYIRWVMSYEGYLVRHVHKFSKIIGRRYIMKRVNGTIAAFKRSGTRHIKLVALLVKGNISSKADQFKINDQYLLKSTRILFFSHVEPIVSPHMCPSIRALILRECHSLNHIKISEIANLKKLRVLEISGCSFLEKIPEDFFAYFDSLETLNLSGTPIKAFPRPNSALRNLRRLILRRCTQLDTFPDVNGLRKLWVLDLSGAMFKLLHDKMWYLRGLPLLNILDLSETNISKLPSLESLNKLTHLLLRNCPLLNKLTPLTALIKLQVIDASGSTKLDDFTEANLPSGDSLRKLDLSSTMIRDIPPLKNASNLVYLCLKGCCQLKELPLIEGAIELCVLDVSDAIQLEKINTSFQEMESLQELSLSNTRIKALPPLSGLESLRKLRLRGCESLQSFPEMDSLINLMLVDLRGCNALETCLDDEQFSDVIVLKS